MKKTYTIIILFILIAGAIFFILLNSSEKSTLGTNSVGYVTKNVYNHYGATGPKIAVVTGMHPREDLSIAVVPQVIKLYALTHNVEIVNYQVAVTDNPAVFSTGRHNGESLVSQYAIPDIKKSDYNLVIICHDHERGYGEGFYIATPTMDSKSVTLASAVHSLLPDFNYYQRDTSKRTQSSSIKKVDAPITASGTPVFVYEMPEWSGYMESFFKSNNLISTSFNLLKTN